MGEDGQKTDYNQKVLELLSQPDQNVGGNKRASIWMGTDALSKFYSDVPERDKPDVVSAVGTALASTDSRIQAQAVRWLAENRNWSYDREIRRLRRNLSPDANEVSRLAVVGYSSERNRAKRHARNALPGYETVGSRN